MMSLNVYRVTCLVALTIILGSRARAQEPAPELHIRLDDALCKDVQDVSVVINGRDNALRAVKVSDCNWKLTGIGGHNLNISYFSLRLSGAQARLGRTPCRRATAIGASNIQLLFTKRGGEKPRELEIAGAPVDYARELPATRHGDVRCVEKGVVPGTLFDVQFDLEDLRLRLFEKKTAACGVLLNHLRPLGKARKGDVVPLTSRELALAVVEQGLAGKNCHAPTFTPFEVVEQSLRGKSNLLIKVK